MSEISLTLVLQIKTSKIIYGMAKVSKKSEKISAYGGIFCVLDKFDRILSSVIDSHLGLRSKTSMDRAMEDIEQGRVYKYDSLDDLIKEIEG